RLDYAGQVQRVPETLYPHLRSPSPPTDLLVSELQYPRVQLGRLLSGSQNSQFRTYFSPCTRKLTVSPELSGMQADAELLFQPRTNPLEDGCLCSCTAKTQSICVDQHLGNSSFE